MNNRLINVNNEVIFRIFLGVLVLFTLSSCRATEDFVDDGCDSFFLWFIPVSSALTIAVCVFEFLAFLIGWGVKYSYEEPGHHFEQIRRGIYNSKGEQIGSFDTGEYKTWFVSEKESNYQKVRCARSGLNIRMTSLIICTWGLVISWIFPCPSFWFWLFFLPICFLRLRRRYRDMDDIEMLLVWEKVFLVICIAAFIVYVVKVSS